MSKLNTNGWKVIMKVLIAIATTILGALGVQEAGNDEWQPWTHTVHPPRHSTYHYNHSCDQLLDSVLLNSPYSKHLRGSDVPQVFFMSLYIRNRYLLTHNRLRLSLHHFSFIFSIYIIIHSPYRQNAAHLPYIFISQYITFFLFTDSFVIFRI